MNKVTVTLAGITILLVVAVAIILSFLVSEKNLIDLQVAGGITAALVVFLLSAWTAYLAYWSARHPVEAMETVKNKRKK